MSGFAAELVERQPASARALVELTRAGTRREWSFGEVAASAALVAEAFARRGVRAGDVVMTLIGNRSEWVLSMLACFRLGAVALPCTEQLRARDLAGRITVARPTLIVADERNRAELEAARPRCPVMLIGEEHSFGGGRGGHGDPGPSAARPGGGARPALITFTSGTAGEPKAVLHGERYLTGQRVQAAGWLGAHAGDLVWCTASSGWSKSARNVFIAPWLCGAAALLHDARFDPHERLEVMHREGVNVLCMAPTEYRVMAKRATLLPLAGLRTMVAAGEALNPEVLSAWEKATGIQIRDGYGQTETGQLTAMPPERPARPGSMGLPLPGMRASIESGELVVDPPSVPTFFLGYLGEGVERAESGDWIVRDRRELGTWRTGDRVRRDEDGYLYFEGRSDDLIISAGYRIGPFEVESALVSHPAVAEAAAVAAPDPERGSVVRAVVVLRNGHHPSAALAAQLQEHVKRRTAPYKYPRIVEFAADLPKTASGKVMRARLRGDATPSGA
ncbi:MAG: AMP-binding protein [Acidobacteriota bacterium]|nr:AMP-binding protein [Acidobacteriota bacterium]